MGLSRKECQDQILTKLKEIGEICKKYNPDADYLSMCIYLSDNYYSANNKDKTDDKDHPICFYVFEGKEDADE